MAYFDTKSISLFEKGIKMKVKDIIYDESKTSREVNFLHYTKGNLWYEVSGTDFYFPVPIEDTGDAYFMRTDKASLYMRYIRKHLESIEEGKNA